LNPFYLPIADISQYVFGPIIFLLSLFMVLLILVQRGRGGGLVGALGGPGGQSAFGTKAGDLFTRITVITAGIWIFLLGFTVWWYTEKKLSSVLPETASTTSASSSMSSGSTSVDAAAVLGNASEVIPVAETVDPKAFGENKAEMKEAASEKPADKPSEAASETAKPSTETDTPAASSEKGTDTPKSEPASDKPFEKTSEPAKPAPEADKPAVELEKPASTDAPKESTSATETSEKK
jgi:preprotein translocase subunit SecG